MAGHDDATEVNGATIVDEIEAVDEIEIPDDEAEVADKEADDDVPARRLSTTAAAIATGGVVVVALGAVAGWLGYRALDEHRQQQTQSAMVEAARQGAVDLTTIDFASVDADIARILNSSIGTFHDDFQQRSQPFIDVVKQAQSKSEGTVTSAGLQSQSGDHGQVLVAVSVKTSNIGAQEQQPRAWRMRIDVQKVADSFKVSNVEFVP